MLRVTAALAVGDALGLWLSTLRAPGGLGALLVHVIVGAGCVLVARAGTGAGARASTALALGFAATGGLALGVETGSRSLRGCAAGVQPGAAVLATGTLLGFVPSRDSSATRRGAGLVRVELADATLVSGGARCSTGRVRAFARAGPVALEAGSIVVARGVWRSPGSVRFPRRAHGYGWIGGASLEPVVTQGSGGSIFVRWRGALSGRLEDRLSARHAPIAKALLLADRSTLDAEVRDAFVDAGVVHLLAISGLHIGLIGAALAWLMGLRIRGPRRLMWAAAVTSAYVVLIGLPPSAVRACLMFWGYALAVCRGRPARVADIAALAAILALLADPLVLTDPGFQLSYAGFTGVVLGGRARVPFERRLGRRGRTAAQAWIVSAAAFLATAPIAAAHFDRLVLASIPASPPATAVVVLALPAVALTALAPAPLHSLFAGATESLLSLLAGIAGWFAALPLQWSGPGLAATTWTIVGTLLALAIDRRGRRRGHGIVAAAAILALGWLLPALGAARERGVALVCTLDVGQGDAAVVRTSRGRWLVFDAGPGPGPVPTSIPTGDRRRMSDQGAAVVVPFLRRHGARAIELLAISHPHLDHFGGTAALFDAFPVRAVVDPAVREPSAAYLGFLERTLREPARWMSASAGDRFRVDDVEIDVLWPTDVAGLGANEGSLSFVLRIGEADGPDGDPRAEDESGRAPFVYVNTGDAPQEVEAAILSRRDGPPDADLLKVGHHGSHTSSALAWLRATRPEIAVISAGRGNRYGHPHAVTLARLDSARVGRVWRTDRDGTLCIEVREDGWHVTSRRSRHAA